MGLRLQPLPGETDRPTRPGATCVATRVRRAEGCVTSCYRCDLRLPRLSRDGPRAESTLSSSPTPHPRASRPARTPALSPEGGVVACREEEEEEERGFLCDRKRPPRRLQCNEAKPTFSRACRHDRETPWRPIPSTNSNKLYLLEGGGRHKEACLIAR